MEEAELWAFLSCASLLSPSSTLAGTLILFWFAGAAFFALMAELALVKEELRRQRRL